MNHKQIAKEQFLHLFFGVMFFMVIGIAAVSLDLLATWVKTLNISSFTSSALEFTAHVMLVMDLVLFSTYLIVASINLIKEMTK